MNIFVLMSFDDEMNQIYRDLIKGPLEKLGHTVKRADDATSDQNILRTIIHGIRDADLIIADLTGQNANVYYELGVAHDMKKPTLHLVQDYKDLAFDLRSYNAIGYSIRFNKATKLTEAILDITERDHLNQYRFSNPVRESLDGDSKIVIETMKMFNVDVQSQDIIEAIRATDTTVSTIYNCIAEINERNMMAHETYIQYKDKINKLQGGDQYSKRLLNTRVLATDEIKFAESLREKMPLLKDSWTALDQDLVDVFLSGSVTTSAEIREISTFIETVLHLKNRVTDIADTLDNRRHSILDNVGLSADVDRELQLSNTIVGNLTDELRVGAAVLSSIIHRSTEGRDRATL